MPATRPAPRSIVRVPLLHPDGPEYAAACLALAASSDQSWRLAQYLTPVVVGLPMPLARRRTLLDVGAGGGQLAVRLAAHFDRTVLVEPNDELRSQAAAQVPAAEVREATAEGLEPVGCADLVVCAHVLHHLPVTRWPEVARRMLSWVTEGGELVVVMPNPAGDVSTLLRRFTRRGFNLVGLRDQLRDDVKAIGATVEMATIPGMIRVESEETLLQVATLILNQAPVSPMPPLRELVDYLRFRFRCAPPQDGFVLSAPQDVLRFRMPSQDSAVGLPRRGGWRGPVGGVVE